MSQAVQRRTWLPACFDSVGYRLSGFLDRLSSCLNGLLGLIEFAWAIDAFADHLGFSTITWRIDARNGQSFPDTLSRMDLLIAAPINPALGRGGRHVFR